jgi:hypothetical protein
MVMPRMIPVAFEVPFPHGAYLVSEVQPVADFKKSTAENKVQQVDKETQLPLWQVEVVDADPDAKRATRTALVKFAAKVQPVPPTGDGSSPFTPVVFEKLQAMAYVEEVMENFSRVAWSYRAESMSAPVRAGKAPSSSEKAVA